MTKYIGTKQINAKPMNKGDYNILRGWKLPADEDFNEEGYLVEYPNSSPCHPDFEGYISWSPKEVFEESYLTASNDISNTFRVIDDIVQNVASCNQIHTNDPYFGEFRRELANHLTVKPTGVNHD